MRKSRVRKMELWSFPDMQSHLGGWQHMQRTSRRRSPTAIGMPKYCSVTVRREENKEAVERIETRHVALRCHEMKWRGVRRGSSRRPKQDMCHRVEEDRRRSSDKHPLNLHVQKK